ncbi:hypothetical protein QE152_g32012 [Popillia japonica]|uniref:Uncharacterized protein n=1 Tax=Popillia japonica TaxID=7064 RepID=A0AAW1J0T9_POPJA
MHTRDHQESVEMMLCDMSKVFETVSANEQTVEILPGKDSTSAKKSCGDATKCENTYSPFDEALSGFCRYGYGPVARLPKSGSKPTGGLIAMVTVLLRGYRSYREPLVAFETDGGLD